MSNISQFPENHPKISQNERLKPLPNFWKKGPEMTISAKNYQSHINTEMTI